MKTENHAARSLRTSESGLVWEEKITNSQTTIKVPMYTTFRVRATGATTVKINTVLAATMSSGEIMVFNSGGQPMPTPFVAGDPTSGNPQNMEVAIEIGGANAFVQVAKNLP